MLSDANAYTAAKAYPYNNRVVLLLRSMRFNCFLKATPAGQFVVNIILYFIYTYLSLIRLPLERILVYNMSIINTHDLPLL